MKKLVCTLLAAGLTLSLAACGGAPSASSSQNASSAIPASSQESSSLASGDTQPATQAGFTCLISEAPAGVPFTDLTWSGFERIKSELGADVKLIEALDKAEYAEQIRAMADMGASPIYTMFDTVNEVAIELAPEYPETMFCVIDSSKDTQHSNVANVYVDSLEPSFIAGFVAAKTTTAKKVGWIGSLDIPVINRFKDSYVAGVKYADPTIEVFTAYIGDDSDTVKAGETAKIMINQGADVIFQTANLAGLGVIKACGDAGVKAIGVDIWQGDVDSCVIWSALTDINGAVFDSYSQFAQGKFQAGKTDYGIKTNSAIYDQRDYDKLPADVKTQLDELLAKIKDGSLDLETLLEQG